MALATLTNFGANFLVSLALPSIQAEYGQAGARAALGPGRRPLSCPIGPRALARAAPAGRCVHADARPPSALHSRRPRPRPAHAATYFAFAAIGVAAVATINAIVPETKGKSLEEIEALWAHPRGDAGDK